MSNESTDEFQIQFPDLNQTIDFKPFLDLLLSEDENNLLGGLEALIESTDKSIEVINRHLFVDYEGGDVEHKVKNLFEFLYSLKHMLKDMKNLSS